MAKSFLDSKDAKDCINCENCINICKLDAMATQQLNGLVYPNTIEEKCVDCGMCKKVCPLYVDKFETEFKQEYAIGWSIDNDVLLQTTSGGMFRVFSEEVINTSGWVYGTEFSREKLAHVAGYNDANIKKFSGSKYVKSKVDSSFVEIKKHLDMGEDVLFGGTPCQCAALKNFLQKDYENLYIIDIICHGSVRPSVFEEYLKYVEKKHNAKIENVRFRNKEKGWKNGQIEISFENGIVEKELFHPKKNLYANVFYSNIALAPGCKDCKYNTMEREGDITLGDFWGCHIYPNIEINENGTSVLLINTEKGKALLERCKDNIVIKEVAREVAIANNPPLYKHTQINPLTNLFCKCIDKFGFMFSYVLCLKVLKVVLLPVRAIKKLKR